MKATILSLLLCILPGTLLAQEIKTLKIATESWAGYTEKDGSGVFFDITNAIFSPHGFEISIEFVPYKRALRLLEEHRADAMYGTYSEKEENKAYIITPNYPIDTETTVAMFKRNEQVKWDGPRSLLRYKSGWVRGYDYHEAIAVQPGFTEVTDTAQGLSMLQSGRFDIYLNPRIELLSSLQSEPKLDQSDYQIETILINGLYMAFAKSERSRQLTAIYDQEFPNLLKSGKLKAIFSKYGRDIPYPEFN